MHPQVKIVGQLADGTIAPIIVSPDGSLLINHKRASNSPSAPSLYEQMLNDNDLYKSIQYYDVGTADERIFMITFSSSNFPIEFSEEYIYEGAVGNYRVVAVRRTNAPPTISN